MVLYIVSHEYIHEDGTNFVHTVDYCSEKMQDCIDWIQEFMNDDCFINCHLESQPSENGSNEVARYLATWILNRNKYATLVMVVSCLNT